MPRVIQIHEGFSAEAFITRVWGPYSFAYNTLRQSHLSKATPLRPLAAPSAETVASPQQESLTQLLGVDNTLSDPATPL